MAKRRKSLKHINHLFLLQERALEARLDRGAKIFADVHLHRLVTNRIFTEYLASPVSPSEWALEFALVYKHLMEGGAVSTMPAPSLDPDVIHELEATVRGDDDTTSSPE